MLIYVVYVGSTSIEYTDLASIKLIATTTTTTHRRDDDV